MNTSRWLILFLLALTINILGIYLMDEWLERISKPLLVVILIIYFLSETKSFGSSLKKWIVGALFFSWLGDLLLMLEEKDSLFFLLGLSAFLVAHIFYILFFHRVKVKENVQARWWLVVIIVIYYTALISLLYPRLGDMKVPVPVYGIVISFMLLLALHMLFIKNKKAGQLLTAGAVLFVISDSVLAVNKFYQPFEYAGIVIMLTYGLAQLFIVKGAAGYIISAHKE